MSTQSPFKSVRCPLYGFVDLNKRETNLLDTAALQRLARIKQLAHTYIVYPSATHTRLEHSLGALCLAGRICERLKLPSKQTQTIRMAALLHDIGQGPFSHIWEEPMRWINGEEYSHEDLTKLLIETEPEIGKALGDLKEDVLTIFGNESLDSDIISSSLDVDKLDYLRRDSYHTGVSYGLFDIERIARTVCLVRDPERTYLGIEEKGMDALESYRLARYAMHIQVYEHHARLIADDMFLKAIRLALDKNQDGCLNPEKLKISRDPNEFIKDFLKLDDFSIQHHILNNSKGIAKDLIQRIRNRRLFKRALETPLTKEGVPDGPKRKRIGEMSRAAIQTIENKIAEELQINPAYVIVHLQSTKIKLYERFEQTLGTSEKPICVKRRNEIAQPIDEISPISAPLNTLRRLYVFCPKRYVKKAQQIAENLFGVNSIL